VASLEKKLVGAVLNRIRERRDGSVGADILRAAESSRTSGALTLRNARLSDFQSIAELKGRYGIVVDPPDNWNRLWWSNPAIARMTSEPAIGWVLESQGRIVGYLGNIHLTYWYGCKPLDAAVGSGLVVEPSYRIFAMRLVKAFFEQKGVDLYLGTTVIEPVLKMSQCFGADLLPQIGCDLVYFWILRPYQFAESITKKVQLSEPFAHLSRLVLPFALRADRILRKRKPTGFSRRFLVTEKNIGEVGEELEAFWVEKRGERTRILADRSVRTLRWHFEIPGFQGTVRVIYCYGAEKLLGYAVVRTNSRDKAGLRRTKVADILASRDDPDVLRALVVAAYARAARDGSDLLEIGCAPVEVQVAIAGWKPYVRSLPSPQFFYKAADQQVHQALALGSAWYASAYDGDTTLMP
jgi:hypothetical protein